MTSRLFLLFFLSIVLNESVFSQPITKDTIYTAGSDVKRKIGVGFMVDSTTTVLTYFQNFTNLPNTFFNLIENGKHIQFSVSYKTATIAENYMFTLVDENDQPVSSGSFSKLPYEISPLGIRYLLPVNEIYNKVISLIVYNKENPKITLTATIYNKPIQKQKINILNHDYNTANEQINSSPLVDKNLTLRSSSKPVFVVMEKTSFDYIYTLFVKDVSTNKVIYENQNWNYDLIESDEGTLPYIKVGPTIFKKPGKYEFIIQPKLRNVDEKILNKYATSKIIEIEWEKDYHLTEILVVVFSTTSLLLLIGFLIYKNRTHRKMQKENFEKRLVETQLNGIRSQLNPHFLFNSLASIQSLVNTNEKESGAWSGACDGYPLHCPGARNSHPASSGIYYPCWTYPILRSCSARS